MGHAEKYRVALYKWPAIFFGQYFGIRPKDAPPEGAGDYKTMPHIADKTLSPETLFIAQ
jgi:hypothetical protein